MRMIAEFEKTGRMSWFSHLDLQSTMQRALRRAKLPVRYSQGYNPHVNLSFATALSVGLNSVCEILDVEMEEEVAPEIFVEKLNPALPEGLKCHKAALIDDKVPAMMALMKEAEYTIKVKGIDLTEKVNAMLKADEVLAEKHTKTTTKTVNIRPLIHDLICSFDGETSTLVAVLENTNANILKVDLLMQTLCADTPFSSVRTGFYAEGKNGRIPLFDAGAGTLK